MKTIFNGPQSTTTASAQPAVQQQGGCCSVPPGAPQSVTTSRWLSIAVIVIHVLALVIFGYINWAQWVASLIGISMGTTLLRNCTRHCYIAATVFFSVGIIFDIIAMLLWFAGVVSAVLGLLPLVGVFTFLLGAIATGKTAYYWPESGAPTATVV